jgi:hypothetical protein
MNIVKLLFVMISVDMNVRASMKLFNVCYFFENSIKFYMVLYILVRIHEMTYELC